jgi:nicotinamide riboside transporter PnuC
MGVTCFWLAGRKVWWAWYVGLVTQLVWLAYSLVTRQWGFLGGVVLYTIVYVKNARSWTLLHNAEKAVPR